MTLKKYLRPKEAADYLTQHTGHPYTLNDIQDLCREGCLKLVIAYTGYLATDEIFEESPRKQYWMRATGFFLSRLALIAFNSTQPHSFQEAPLMVKWEIIETTNAELAQLETRFIPFAELPVKARSQRIRDAIFDPCNDIFVPRSELDALIAQHQADSTPSPAPVAVTEPAPQQTEAPPEALSAKASALPAELAAVLDTTHPDHAPDLAEAIRLWLALYGGETTKHSHSNACGHWMKAQGISDSFIDSTAGRRIKEVTSPQRAWDAQRKERHASRKKQD